MKLLLLAFVDKEYPQILRKINAKFLALRSRVPDTRCYVIGNGDPRAMSFYALHISIIYIMWTDSLAVKTL